MKHVSLRIIAILLSMLFFGISLNAQSTPTSSSGEEVLTNDSVIRMVKANLSPIIITSKIRTSRSNFNVSTDELIRLQQQEKIPDEVIRAMVDASSAATANSSLVGAGNVSNTDPNDPLATHEAGIYLYDERSGQKVMIQLEPSVSKQTKSGGFFTSALTYGIAKIKFKASLAGPNAKLQIEKSRPVFYFYFEVKSSGLSNSSGLASSPSDFVLVKLNAKDNSRNVTVAQANAFGSQSGTMDKASRPYDFEKIAPGVYKVTPNIDLDGGEYGFYNAAGLGPSGGAKIFDFGIKVPH